MENEIINTPDMIGLEFEDATHTYRLDGMEIPSVSTIIKPLSEIEYREISEETLNNAAKKGTEVHNAIENWIKFEIDDISPEKRPFLDAYLKWWRNHDIRVVESEWRIYHKIMRYGGTLDLLAYVDGYLTLIDYKTTYTILDMVCGPQLEAYSQALSSHGIKVDKKMILHLRKDGTYKEKFFPIRDTVCWQVFSALKTVYDYEWSNR